MRTREPWRETYLLAHALQQWAHCRPDRLFGERRLSGPHAPCYRALSGMGMKRNNHILTGAWRVQELPSLGAKMLD